MTNRHREMPKDKSREHRQFTTHPSTLSILMTLYKYLTPHSNSGALYIVLNIPMIARQKLCRSISFTRHYIVKNSRVCDKKLARVNVCNTWMYTYKTTRAFVCKYIKFYIAEKWHHRICKRRVSLVVGAASA